MKFTRLASVLLSVLAMMFIVTAGCTKQGDKTLDTAAGALDAIQGPAAIVNGQEITFAELKTAVRNAAMSIGQQGAPAEEIMAKLAPSVLDQMVTGMLLFQAGEKEGFAVSDQAVDTAFTSISSQYQTPEEFQAEMARRGFTEQSLKKDISRQLTIRKYIETTIASKIEVTEADARQFFDQNPDKFKTPEQVKASHILIKSSAKDSDDAKETARKKAQDLADKARQKGTDFAGLAKANSEGPTGPRGGELDYFGRGEMLKPFEEAAFSMKIGQISDPVLTEYGYHIIKVTDRKEESAIPFEQVSQKIAVSLKNGEINKQIGNRIKELSAAAKIEIKLPADKTTPAPVPQEATPEK